MLGRTGRRFDIRKKNRWHGAPFKNRSSMSLSRSSRRVWSLYSRNAWSFTTTTTTITITPRNTTLSYNTLTAKSRKNLGYLAASSLVSVPQRRTYAGFKRYTMDQALVTDLKSQPRDALLLRNGDSKTGAPRTRTAYIALGSNLGDRVAMVEQACRELDVRGIKVKRTSSLWETEPMYVLDQDRFVNGACEVCASHFHTFCCLAMFIRFHTPYDPCDIPPYL